MDNLIRRNKEKAVIEDEAEIIRQREARYRAELDRMAVDQAARITGLDDRDRRTLQSIREEIRDVKVTIQDTGGIPMPAPVESFAWELSFAAPADGAQYQIGSDYQDTYAIPIRVAWRLDAALGPSETAEAVLLAGRVSLDFGDGKPSESALMAADGIPPFEGGAYSGEIYIGMHAYPPGRYRISAGGGGPLAGHEDVAIEIAVLDYVAPAVYDYWTWDGGFCVEYCGPAIPAGSYGSLAACQAAHPPPVTFWIWDGAACQMQTAPAAPAGSYPSLAECQQAHPTVILPPPPPPPPPPPLTFGAWRLPLCEYTYATTPGYTSKAECVASMSALPPPAFTPAVEVSNQSVGPPILTAGGWVYLSAHLRAAVTVCPSVSYTSEWYTYYYQMLFDGLPIYTRARISQSGGLGPNAVCAGGWFDIDWQIGVGAPTPGVHVARILFYTSITDTVLVGADEWVINMP